MGERIPADVLTALEDESVIKWAFNASFERVCLSRYLGYPIGEYLSPHSWHCSMIWSAYMGLPLSLKGAGAVLGLDKQKMGEGADLIKYFCKPCTATNVNGGRTRNMPTDAPDKWATFKEYNKRDVEVEIQIQRNLSSSRSRFCWRIPHIEEINDAVSARYAILSYASELMPGLAVSFHRNAGHHRLENPNSVMQMRLACGNGLESTA